jgi:hypothetical protein
MPEQPVTRRSSPPTTASAPDPGSDAAPAQAPEITVNKVLAGAGAAATSAVLGSFFGSTGTVAGAALGSVALTVATTLYQRSLDRTRDTIVARIKVRPGRGTGVADRSATELTVPIQRVSPDAETTQRVSPEAETTQLRVEPAPRRRLRPRQLWLLAGVTVLVFVLGLLAVTGVEWAKGSTLTTGRPGTSVGRVLAPAATPAEAGGGKEQDEQGANPEPDLGSGSGSDLSPEPGSDGSGADDPGTDDAGADGAHTDGTDSDRSDAEAPSSAESPTPSREPGEEPAPADEADEPGSATAPTGTADEGERDGDPLRTPPAPVPAAPPSR